MIEDREYLKRDLARIYTPHTRQAKSAMKKLREDINHFPELTAADGNHTGLRMSKLFMVVSEAEFTGRCRKTFSYVY